MAVVLRPWLLRSRRRAGLLVVVAVIAAVLAAVAGTAVTLVLQAPTTELRAALSGLPTAGRTIAVEASGEPSAQDRAFRRLVRQSFRDVPLLVERSVSGGTTTWTVGPDPERITAGDLDGLRAGLHALPAAAAGRFADDGGASTRRAGEVRGNTAVLVAAVSAVRAAAPVPLSVVVVAGAVALLLAGRLLAGARTTEDRRLRARGAPDGLLVGVAGLEALVVGVIGAGVGSVAGSAVAGARWGTSGPPTTAVIAVVAAGAVTVLVVGAVVGATVSTFRGAEASAAPHPTRGAVVRNSAVVVLLVVLAGVAVWRYRDTAAATAGDPLAVIAPAALLTALAVAGALVLSPVLAVLARVSSGRPGLVRPLGLRLAARDGRRLFVPAALLVLAVASGVFTATVDTSTRSFLRDSERVEQGAALRADVGGPLPLNGPSDLLPVGVRDDGSAADGVRPVLRLTGAPGDAAQTVRTVRVVGLDTRVLPAMLPVAAQTFDATRAVRGLRTDLPGVALGTSSTGGGRPLDLGVRTSVASASTVETAPDGSTESSPTTGADVALQAVAWLVDDVGDVVPVTTSSRGLLIGGSADARLTGTIPAGGPWRLAALDLRFRGDADLDDVRVDVRSLAVAGNAVALPEDRWTAAPDAYDASGLRDDADSGGTDGGIGIGAPSLALAAQPGSTVGVRLMPDADRVVSVLASTATGSSTGDTVTVTGDWSSFRARVVGTAATIPGTDGGAAYLADLPALDQAVLAASQRPQRVREVWAAHDASRAALTAALPDAALSEPSTVLETGFARLVVLALLAGTAAALFCAVLVLAATAAAVARDRREEALGLRLSGVTASQQARLRAVGPALTSAFGLLVGIVAGTAAAALLGTAAVRASVPRAPAGLGVPLVPTWGVVVAVLSVAAAAGVVVTVVHAAAVRRAARRTGLEAR